jgi:hypothetical protein
MSRDFIRKNQQPTVRQKEKDTASDTNYTALAAYEMFLKETKRKDITYREFCGIPKKIHLSLWKDCYVVDTLLDFQT